MKLIKIIYLILLTYILVTIVFWGSSLSRLSNKLYDIEQQNLKFRKSELTVDEFKSQSNKLIQAKQSRTRQYLGEGATFLIVIFIGAAIVYTSVRRSNKLSSLQNNFMLSITHELKSPIAGVKLNLQTLRRKNLPEDKRLLLIERAIKESDRLHGLCENLLLASQMEGKRLEPNMKEFSFSELCIECIEDFENRSTHKITGDIENGLTVLGDATLWKIAISNLIENAIKYTPQGDLIELSVHKQDDHILLSVKDQGIGIPDEEKLKIYNKFYRIGEENSRKTKGTGLGLYLVAEIAKIHNTNIIVSDNKPKGSIFEINIDAVSAG